MGVRTKNGWMGTQGALLEAIARLRGDIEVNRMHTVRESASQQWAGEKALAFC